mmetsp:Transcript_100594/g.284964  ORF Transcript_100594/g.284964 Transcript_100594/m.284964 type:complete len:294 (+) Transcript_100594:1145-2026(+)
MGALQQLGVELPEHAADEVLQLFGLPAVDLRSQQRDQLRVEVLRAPVRSLGAAQALEEREGRGGRVHEGERELQRQARDLRQLVEEHRPLQLAAPAHGVRASRAGRDREVGAAVGRVDLLPLLRLLVLHQVLAHAGADLREVYLAPAVPEHLVVPARPALARRDELLRLHARGRPRVHQQAVEGGLQGTRELRLCPPLPLEALRDAPDARLALELEGLAEHLAVLHRLPLGVALRPLHGNLAALRPRKERMETSEVFLAPRISDDVALFTLHCDVDYVLLRLLRRLVGGLDVL